MGHVLSIANISNVNWRYLQYIADICNVLQISAIRITDISNVLRISKMHNADIKCTVGISLICIKAIGNWGSQMCISDISNVHASVISVIHISDITNFNLLILVMHFTDITRAHSFPRAVEFRAEPRNLAFAMEFPCFRGISRNFA